MDLYYIKQYIHCKKVDSACWFEKKITIDSKSHFEEMNCEYSSLFIERRAVA